MEKLKELFIKYKQLISYLFFGGLTTLVNLIIYYLFAKVFSFEEIVSSGLSWFGAVLFAYITNKIFVFESKSKDHVGLFKEIVAFFGCRLFSGLLCEIGIFAWMVKAMKIDDLIAKLVTQILVIILNFVLSKFIVFNNIKSDKIKNIK